MVSAPVIVLLYDRTFLAGSFRDAIRTRWKLYAGLAATWLLLAALVIGGGGRAGTAGFGLRIGAWQYALDAVRRHRAISSPVVLAGRSLPRLWRYGRSESFGRAARGRRGRSCSSR